MAHCTPDSLFFSPLKGKKIEANFEGGSITSDAGLLLLREVDKKLGLSRKLSQLIEDSRHPSYIDHSVEDLLKQRVYALSAGYEDVNDHDTLNKDLCFQTAVGREATLASSSTLSRFENSITRQSLVNLSKQLVELFIESHHFPPKELILDFDPTDHVLHGHQEQRHYHGYYKANCFLPLQVFCGDQLLVSFLRPSNIDGAKYGGALLRLLVKRLRQAWPEVSILFRGDSAFARKRLLYWCENNNVSYITGISGNSRLKAMGKTLTEQAEKNFEETKEKQRLFGDFSYQAKSWKRARRVIAKVEHHEKGNNFRCIMTNLKGDPQALYDQAYCPRGDMENGIKQLKLDLYSDRNSCHDFMANQFRLLLSSFAYVLINELRQTYLSKTELAKAYCGTIRLKLFKIGAIVLKNSRRIRFLLSSHYPYQHLFTTAVQHFAPP